MMNFTTEESIRMVRSFTQFMLSKDAIAAEIIVRLFTLWVAENTEEESEYQARIDTICETEGEGDQVTMKEPEARKGPLCMMCDGSGKVFSSIDLPPVECAGCKGRGYRELWLGESRQETS